MVVPPLGSACEGAGAVFEGVGVVFEGAGVLDGACAPSAPESVVVVVAVLPSV
jgi:hypothetical protein